MPTRRRAPTSDSSHPSIRGRARNHAKQASAHDEDNEDDEDDDDDDDGEDDGDDDKDAHPRTDSSQVGPRHDDHVNDLERVAVPEQQHQPLRGRAQLQQHGGEDYGRRGFAEET